LESIDSENSYTNYRCR